MIELRTVTLEELGQSAWNALLRPSDPPFLRFEWFDALEGTGAASAGRGWAPLHLGLYRDGSLVAVAPAYLKGNSQGEFVFDHAIAQFAETRLGIPYYPKLVVAVPFTPATSRRLIVASDDDRDELLGALASGLRELCKELDVSSAHVLFPSVEESAVLARFGMAERLGLQYHWQNGGYGSFDDFLAGFSSKRRHQLRRERRLLAESGIVLESRAGDTLSREEVDFVFECYRNTVEHFYWGRQYLSREFFHEVTRTLGQGIHVVLARSAGGTPIGSAFNLVSERALFGRYWGATAEHPFLHFNVCYYEGIDECIRRGLDHFEPGAGGEHKRARGFHPTATRSVHCFADPRLEEVARDFFAREARAILEHIAETRTPRGGGEGCVSSR